ncbi:MAG: glutamine synthetase family protein [bacterium]
MKGKIEKKDLKKLIDGGQIDTIIMAGVDLQGRLYGKRLVAETFLEHFKGGINTASCNFGWDMDLILIPGMEFTGWHTGYQDMCAVPDYNTMRIYPWFEKTAIVLCDTCDEDGNLLEIAPRTILRRQVEKARKMGFSPLMASELEFFIYKCAPDEARNNEYRNLDPLFKYYGDYSILRTSIDEWILGPIRKYLQEMGMEVESFKGEWGHGQLEIGIVYQDALEMGDRHVLVKQGIKEICALNGLTATFMAKPSTADSGNGLHIHTSLWDRAGKKNLLWSARNEHHMSDKMRWYLGGMMQLAKDLQVFYAPNINSYKRYVPESFAPYNNTWGGDNRTTTFRLCGTVNSYRVENRIPGADANAYLALAACLGSGLYGIENKLEPVGEFCEGDAYKQKGAPVFALNLPDALRNFDNSKIAREILGDPVVDHYARLFAWECERYFTEVTDWERRKYFEMA